MEATEMLAGVWKKNEEKMHSFNIKEKPTKLRVCMMTFAQPSLQSPRMHSPLCPWPKPSPSHMPSAARVSKGSY
jgi:hypothetical protein